MISSSTTMRSSLHLSQIHKNPNNSITHYIFKQEHNDHQLEILLAMLSQFNSLVQLEELEKGREKCAKLVKQLERVDGRHRSYDRVRSLVNGSVILVCLGQGDMAKVESLVDEQQDIAIGINSPEYIGKVYLLRVLILLIKSKHQQQSQPSLQSQRQIKKYYKKFERIKFSSSDTYCDHRLWQSVKMIQILVYQYILVVQKLAQYDQYKSYFLYKRGLNIAKRLLGRDHRFARMMSKIMKIRRQTNKLIRLQPIGTSSIVSSSSKSRPKSLVHKKLNKILNPQLPSHNPFSKIYTETSYSMTKSKLTKSQYQQNKKQQNSKRLYTLQQQTSTKGGKILNQQPKIKQKIQQNNNLQILLHNKLTNKEQISSMLNKIGSRTNSKTNNNSPSLGMNKQEKDRVDVGKIIYIQENQIELDNNNIRNQGQNGNQWNCQLI